MKLSICTISYRHHLKSIQDIALFAKDNQFDSIELWGIHAKHLTAQQGVDASVLESYGLTVSMLSDYLPLDASEDVLMEKVHEMMELGERWGTKRIRTFAGQKASKATTKMERSFLVQQLRTICHWVGKKGQQLLIETHPNTLADTMESTLQLMKEVNHPALRVNFDVLHVWEAKADPIEGFHLLEPYISHLHLKNIASFDQLNVFEPGNVYAAAGNREGMVSLFEGAVDYRQFLTDLAPKLNSLTASFEWFGPDPDVVLRKDKEMIEKVLDRIEDEVANGLAFTLNE